MSDKYQGLKDHLESLAVDIEKFYLKGQSAAGTRVRKGLSDLKKLAQEMRNEVQDLKAQRKSDKS